MNSVRTTIVFDQDLHRQLSLQAVGMGVSLSDLVNKKLLNNNVGANKSLIKDQINADLAFFKSFGRKMGKVDWVKAVREERDRDSE